MGGPKEWRLGQTRNSDRVRSGQARSCPCGQDPSRIWRALGTPSPVISQWKLATGGASDILLNADYLEYRVTLSEDKLMDADSKAVMMVGETFDGGSCQSCLLRRWSQSGHWIGNGSCGYCHSEMCTCHAHWLSDKDNVGIIFSRWQDGLYQLESYDGNSRISVALLPTNN